MGASRRSPRCSCWYGLHRDGLLGVLADSPVSVGPHVHLMMAIGIVMMLDFPASLFRAVEAFSGGALSRRPCRRGRAAQSDPHPGAGQFDPRSPQCRDRRQRALLGVGDGEHLCRAQRQGGKMGVRCRARQACLHGRGDRGRSEGRGSGGLGRGGRFFRSIVKAESRSEGLDEEGGDQPLGRQGSG